MLLSACHLQIHLEEQEGKEFWTNLWEEHSWLCSARAVIGRRALSLKHCLRSRPLFAIDPPALNSICVADDSGLWKSAATNYSQIMGNTAFGDSSNSMSGDRFYSTFVMFSLIFLQKHNGVVFMAGCSKFDHTENVHYTWCMTSNTSKFCKIVALLINNNNISWRGEQEKTMLSSHWAKENWINTVRWIIHVVNNQRLVRLPWATGEWRNRKLLRQRQ